ncbi:hypothetical protein [Citrobacter amalonaticus]|uniref:DUF551 domain-containing protein n=1 Tax=Citrobacter amalonaticus TaxID=35703 RepID=A0A6N2REF6_CITAM
MTTITKERVAEIIHAAGLEPCDYEEVFGSIKTGEIVAMARIALASLNANPVYQYRERPYSEWMECSERYYQVAKEMNAGFTRILFTATPSPVVPDEVRNKFKAEGLADLLRDVRDYAPLTSEQWETLTNNWHQTFVGLSGENDSCRAAMLQGSQPVSNRDELSSPVIPDGYALVPVEPSMAMLDEFDSIIDYGAEDSKDAWRRLLAAAPQQEAE